MSVTLMTGDATPIAGATGVFSAIGSVRPMTDKILYTAAATVTGGRIEGHGKTSDGALEVDLRLPPELGGQGGGTNPEQLFAIGFASCFESAIGAVARRIRVEPQDVKIDSRVNLHPTPERGFKLSVLLIVTMSGLEGQQAKELVEAAHHVCPYSNATRGNIDVDITVNGEPVT
jgi:lipoyl-dependent peroxiredoxin